MFSQNLDPQPSWGRVCFPSLQVQAGLSDLIKMNSVRQKGHCLTSEAMKQKWYNFRLATQSPSCKEVQTHPHGRPNGVGLCGAGMRSPVNSQKSATRYKWLSLPVIPGPSLQVFQLSPKHCRAETRCPCYVLPKFLMHKIFEYNKSLSSMSA